MNASELASRLNEHGESAAVRVTNGDQVIVVRDMPHSLKQAEWLLYHLEQPCDLLQTHIGLCAAIAARGSASGPLREKAGTLQNDGERLKDAIYSPDTGEKYAELAERMKKFLSENVGHL